MTRPFLLSDTRRRSDVSGAWQTVGDAWEPPVLAIAFLGALPKQSLQILEVDVVQPDGVVIRVLGGRLHLRLGEDGDRVGARRLVRVPARVPHRGCGVGPTVMLRTVVKS